MCHGTYQECWLKHLVRFDRAAAAAAVAVAAAAANVKSLPFMSAAPTPAAKLTASRMKVSGPVQPCRHSNATCSRAVAHHVPCSYMPCYPTAKRSCMCSNPLQSQAPPSPSAPHPNLPCQLRQPLGQQQLQLSHSQAHPEAAKPAKEGANVPWTAGTLDVDLNAKPDGEAKVQMRQGKGG